MLDTWVENKLPWEEYVFNLVWVFQVDYLAEMEFEPKVDLPSLGVVDVVG